MPTDPISLSERVSSSFSQLYCVAADLNAVSDELGRSVAHIDDALKKLNLGITVWVKISGWSGGRFDEEAFFTEDIGYARVGNKWGISLRKVEGNHRDPDDADVESWLFNDAPRALRLSAIDKIPELLEKLSSEAAKATAMIQKKLADAQAVAAAVNGESPQSKKVPPVKPNPAFGNSGVK